MKKLLIFISMFILASCVQTQAQRLRKYIYIFDCTKSMLGKNWYKDNIKTDMAVFKDYPDKLFCQATEYVVEDIKRQSSNSEIVIIPFTAQTPSDNDILCFQRENFDDDEVRKCLVKKLSGTGNTGICNAWDKALKYINPDKDNYFYLLTDGDENIHPDRVNAVCDRIQNWNHNNNQNFAFFVSLVDITSEKQIKSVIDSNNRTYFVKGHSAPFGVFSKENCNVNVHTLHPITVDFSTEGRFPVTSSCNDDYFNVSVENNNIDKGKITLLLEPKKELDEEGVHVLNVKINGNKKDINIINPDLKINVDTKPVSGLNLKADEIDCGTSYTYDDFLFGLSSAKECDTLYVDLEAVFNELAIQRGASFNLKITSKDLKASDYEVIYQNQKGNINIKASEKVDPVKIVIHSTVKDEDYTFEMKGWGEGLENINDEQKTQYDNKIRFEKDTCMNPVKKGFIWFIVIIVSLLMFWFAFLKRIMYPGIRLGYLQITYPDGNYAPSKNIRGARQVVLCNRAGRQGMVNRIFTGRIVYVVSNHWTNPIELSPNGMKRELKINMHGNYMINPVSYTLVSAKRYTIVNNKTNGNINLIIS